MVAMFQDLVRHKGFVDAGLLKAIRRHEPAAQDQELRRLLHHILLANRFWFSLARGVPFEVEAESRVPDSLGAIASHYAETHAQELEWISRISEADLERQLESQFFPGKKVAVAQGYMQVCMHSHGHRSQCATRLRALGGTPPVLDFILWLTKDRPAADWS